MNIPKEHQCEHGSHPMGCLQCQALTFTPAPPTHEEHVRACNLVAELQKKVEKLEADHKKVLQVADYRVKLEQTRREWWQKRAENLAHEIQELIKKKADSDELERHFRYRI